MNAGMDKAPQTTVLLGWTRFRDRLHELVCA